MQIHELKTWDNYFTLMAEGKKKFEWRKNDRNFATGDLIYLRETYREHPDSYTGRVQLVQITCIVDDTAIGIPNGYAILGVVPIKLEITPMESSDDQ